MVSYDREGPVAIITIDRPDHKNAIDRQTASELGDAWDRFEDDEEALVGVLHGANGTFSAGADLKAMDLEDTPEGGSASPAGRCRNRRLRQSKATVSLAD
jgi:enoyl-CoA hydratase